MVCVVHKVHVYQWSVLFIKYMCINGPCCYKVHVYQWSVLFIKYMCINGPCCSSLQFSVLCFLLCLSSSCVFCFVCLRRVFCDLILHECLDYPFLIAPTVFSNMYLISIDLPSILLSYCSQPPLQHHLHLSLIVLVHSNLLPTVKINK